MRVMRTAALGVALAAALAPAAAWAQYTVYDPTAAANMGHQIAEAKAQLSQLQQTYNQVTRQLEQARRTHEAMTGQRSVSSLNTTGLRQYLPADYRRVYDRAMQGGYQGITGSVAQVLESEVLTGTPADQQRALVERRQRSAAARKVVAEDAFESAERRLEYLDDLQARIAQTEDPKAIADLQARIAVEQAAIANEQTKLQLLREIAEAEERLAAEQRRAAAAKVWSNSNKGMPTIRR